MIFHLVTPSAYSLASSSSMLRYQFYLSDASTVMNPV